MNNSNSLKNNSSLIAGGIVITIGVIILLKQLNILGHLGWLFNWKTLLIGVGLVSGAKRNFAQPFGWLIPIGIGVMFLIGDYTNIHLARYIVPVVIIGVGLVMILNASTSGKWLKDFERKNFGGNTNNYAENVEAEVIDPTENNTYSNTEYSNTQSNSSVADTINVNSFFSGSKQVVMHKNFKGGTINAVMGGAEVNLMQADMPSPAILDVTVIMGGLKLVIPANWEIKNDISALFGGVEDARPQIIRDVNTAPKIIVLRGTAIMGGVEIKSF
jgi:hypothetical protein